MSEGRLRFKMLIPFSYSDIVLEWPHFVNRRLLDPYVDIKMCLSMK